MSLAWRHRGLLSPWHICNEMSRTCHVSPSVMSVSRARDRVLLPLPSPGANCPLIGQSWQYRPLIGWSHLSPRAADWGLSSHIEAWSCSADNILMHVLYAPSSLCYLAWLVFCLHSHASLIIDTDMKRNTGNICRVMSLVTSSSFLRSVQF